MGEQGSKELWTGPCIGGPMSMPGSPVGQSRYPMGFVLVDKPNKLAWIYEWSELDDKFFVRDESPMELDAAQLMMARDSNQWDIRSAEVEVSRGYHQHPKSGRAS